MGKGCRPLAGSPAPVGTCQFSAALLHFKDTWSRASPGVTGMKKKTHNWLTPTTPLKAGGEGPESHREYL